MSQLTIRGAVTRKPRLLRGLDNATIIGRCLAPRMTIQGVGNDRTRSSRPLLRLLGWMTLRARARWIRLILPRP